jgi:predicted nuclease of predicted toxin-antitoxin system
MKIKVDEDLPKGVAFMLRDNGYDAITVLEQGMGGWKDPSLWVAVQNEGRFLVTADKGFADVRAFPPGSHVGVLLLRPGKDGIQPTLNLLAGILKTCRLDLLTGTVTVATPRGLRIRLSSSAT